MKEQVGPFTIFAERTFFKTDAHDLHVNSKVSSN